ncbi:uncharacterized protein LOC130118557 [Lampris incognitus]|uniref:uncharacterized protein LOC130118557 n=1 Tax=Lampris incognitus TaxID=2546036 RepID=UPI0024B5829F|nr:uncharacterized protein LOC130118557 [Lampris incognitus]
MVAERDKEIQLLERRSGLLEDELRLFRRQGCACRMFADEHDGLVRSEIIQEFTKEEESNFGSSSNDNHITTEQECEMGISLGFLARPPSQISQSHMPAPSSSPPNSGTEQTCTSHSSQTSVVSNSTINCAPSPKRMVKEEPCDIDSVLINWEVSEQRFEDHPESISASCGEKDGPLLKGSCLNRERLRKYREKMYADPAKHCEYKQQQFSNKRSVPMSELTEEAQTLKRAAWRAASRRYYARKVARQQGAPMQPGPFPQNSSPLCLPRVAFREKRRKTLISELPAETQTMQREAWRVASRRYYARKVARLHADPAPFSLLMPNTETCGEIIETNQGDSQANMSGLGGTMCS